MSRAHLFTAIHARAHWSRSTCRVRRSFTSWSDLSRLLPGGLGGEDGKLEPLGGASEERIIVYREEKIMPFSQRQLFDLVADVEAYSSFIPFCTSSMILNRSTAPSQGRTDDQKIMAFDASLSAGFMGISQAFVSRVECKPYEFVKSRAIRGSGLFQHLVTNWHFRPNESSAGQRPTAERPSTRVEFELEFAFGEGRDIPLSKETWGVLTRKMISAFENRATELYQ